MTAPIGRSCRWVLALVLVATVGAHTALAATPVASPIADELQPVLAQYQDEFSTQLNTMPSYDMDLVLDRVQSTIGGNMMVTFPNVTGVTQDVVPFRLYPNASYYAEGETTIENISVGGISITPRFDESGTVLFVDLPATLDPGKAVTISLDFTTVIPMNSDGSFGILNNDVGAQHFVLADWYPVIAGWDDTGWRLETPTEQGDPTFSTTSLYRLRLVVPDGYVVIATGEETTLDDGAIQIESGPVREFAMVVAQGMESISASAGDTTVSVHVSPEHLEGGQQVLDIAVAALNFYNESFGAYPFRELDLVESDLSLAYGVSWSGILFINESLLSLSPDNAAALDFTVFHEVGHQWWGATVGANSNDHTYMVEGLTNATALLAQAAVQGPEAATNSLYAWMVTPYANLLAGSGDAVADVSIFDQPPSAPLSTLAYGKGGLGFLAIRNQIGDIAFREGLAAYAEQFRLGIAEPSDLLAAFETASGQSLQELWSFWFDTAQTTPADLETLVPEIIASLG